MPEASTDVGVAVTVLLIALLIGGLTFSTISNGVEERHEALETRAERVYGDDYSITSSDRCWDVCVPTATTSAIQQRGILIMADRQVGWTSANKLREAVPGFNVKKPAYRLVEKGLLERRQRDGLAVGAIYRYVGPEGQYEGGLSDTELRQLVREQLYVTGTWMSEEEIVSSVPAAKWRVRQTLADLEEDGVVKSATEPRSSFSVFADHTVFAHTSVSVDRPPGAPGGILDLLVPTVVVIGLTIAMILVGRWRRGLKEESEHDDSAGKDDPAVTE